MYSLSRFLLAVAALCGLFSLLLLLMTGWPVVILAVGLVGVAQQRNSAQKQLETLGSARWASEAELKASGMLASNSGLVLGRLQTSSREPMSARVARLFSPRVSAAAACAGIWSRGWRLPGPVVRLPQAVHTAVIAPTGIGKGRCVAVPFLTTCGESAVVLDIKGELASLTAEFRRKQFGHQIVLLDPFHVVTSKPDSLNPLDFIDAADPRALDACNDLAKAMVVRSGDEKEPHWSDSAEAWIAGVLGTIVGYGNAEGGTRSLQTLRDVLTRTDRLDLAVKLMGESEMWDGMLARMGGQLAHYADKEKSSVLTTVARHTRFLDSLAIREATQSSSFNPAKLRSGKMTVYLILPPEHSRAQAAFLRLIIDAMMCAVIRGGLTSERKVHFLMDEAASLGHLESIDDALDKYRGFGVRLILMYQSQGQLRKCFPDGQDQTLLANTTQIYFGVNDNVTAEYVSTRLGEHTITVASGGTTTGSSWSSNGAAEKSQSRGSNDNWALQARKLLKPEEVIALSPRTALTFTPGMPPICTTLMRYDEEPSLSPLPITLRSSRLRSTASACLTLACSAVICLASMLFALALLGAFVGPHTH